MIEIHQNAPPEFGEIALQIEIESDIKIKNGILEQILSILREKNFLQDSDEVWTRLCLDEILVNAIRHGNKEDKNKKVSIKLFIDDNKWGIRVEDEGEGFKPEDIPDVNTKDAWELEHGRGILLMKNYMDTIWYFGEGTKVQLEKIKKNKFRRIIDKILSYFNFV